MQAFRLSGSGEEKHFVPEAIEVPGAIAEKEGL